MRKKHYYIIWIVLVMILVGAAFGLYISHNLNNNIENEVAENQEENVNNGEKEVDTLEDIVREEMSAMTLREKIGQMIMIAYRQADYNDELDNILKEVKPSGFVLFSENISTYDNTVKYIEKIRESENVPMFISIDQEGGRVQRIKGLQDANVLEIPDMLSLGNTQDDKLAYNVGSVLAKEIAAFGINMDFAPVLDVFSNEKNTVIGNRAFGTNADTVIKMALPFSNGMKDNGIIPVCKHFPGHGDTYADSHVELPIVYKTKDELYEQELLPFKAAIKNDIQAIMVAHIALTEITGDNTPASLSKEVITEILRKEMEYDGLVITDAIEMKALADNYSIDQICDLAINAGVDIILMPEDPIELLNTIEKLVNDGKITKERIDESVSRILKVKHQNNLYEKKNLDKNNIGTQENIDIINSIYQ